MDTQILSSSAALEAYDRWVRGHSGGSLWQSLAWRRYQEGLGRETRVYVRSAERIVDSGKYDATALVIIDKTSGGLSTWEIPRGPLGDPNVIEALMGTIIDDAKKDRCIALYFSPPQSLSSIHYPLSSRHSTRHIHPEATLILDLTQSEESILKQMHPKGRYNIKTAERHGVDILKGNQEDIEAFYSLLKATADRDRFRVLQKSHYTRFLSHLEGSFLLLAMHENRAIAGLLGVRWNGTGIYYYGASSYEHRNLMAPYLLQWEAVKLCKEAGCHTYDLLGIESEKMTPLRLRASEGQANDQIPMPKTTRAFGHWSLGFGHSTSSWQGITEFKKKFGGKIVTYPPEQMVVLRPMVKRALEWKRRIFG